MTHVATNVDKPACRCSQEILCENIQKFNKKKALIKRKKNSSISRKPKKAT